MLYPTLNQGLIFLCLFGAGFACGFLFDIVNILLCTCNQNKIVKHILQFFCTILSVFALFLLNLRINLGQFRFFVIFFFLFALLLQRICIGIWLNKLIIKLFNAYQHKKSLKNQKKLGKLEKFQDNKNFANAEDLITENKHNNDRKNDGHAQRN